MMLQYMQKMEQIAQSQQASIQSLERQVGQLAKALTKSEPSKFPCTTEVNPKEGTMSISLCLEKVLDDPVAKVNLVLEKKYEIKVDDWSEKIEEAKKGENDQRMKLTEVKAYMPPIPFLQKLKKNAIDELYQKFVDMLKKLQVHMPFFFI